MLLPPAVLLSVLLAPVWLVLKLCFGWTDCGQEVVTVIHENCFCMPNRYGPSCPLIAFRYLLGRILFCGTRVTEFAFGCEWCSDMHGVWWPWHECSVRWFSLSLSLSN